MLDPDSPEPTGVTLGEVVRTLHTLSAEIRALRGEHVRRDLYEANQAALRADITRLGTEGDRLRIELDRLAVDVRQQEEARASGRRQFTVTWISVAALVVTSLITLIFRH